MSCSERKKEIRRRRHRREKLNHMKRRLQSANTSERQVIEAKVRQLTPGAAQILEAWGLKED